MHTPYCIELRGTLPTVVVPRRNSQWFIDVNGPTTIGAPTLIEQQFSQSQGIVVSAMRRAFIGGGDLAVMVVFCFQGYSPGVGDTLDPTRCVVLGQQPGTVRYIGGGGERITAVGVLTLDEQGGEGAASIWVEDLAPLGYGQCKCVRSE